MKGHLRKRGRRYYCVFDVPTEDGRRKQKWVAAYPDRKRSEKLLTKLVNEVNEGIYIEPSDEPLKDYLKEWLRTKKGNVSRETYDHYLSLCKNHIIPRLGKYKLNTLKIKHVKNFYNDLKEHTTLTPGSIYRIHIVLRNALNSAVEEGAIRTNPAKYEDAPKRPRKEMLYWDEQDAWKFLDTAKGERTYIAFYLAIKTGMRQGEILGLKWSDIDLERKTITIQRELSHKGDRFQPPKTESSQRTIEIHDKTIEQLKKHYVRIKQERLRAGEMYEENGLVIPTGLGTPLLPRNLNRTWYRLRKKAGVPEIRFHDLRHTHVAISIKAGHSLKAIAERIGHSSTQHTADTYAHLLPGVQESAAAKFDEHFYSEKPAEKDVR